LYDAGYSSIDTDADNRFDDFTYYSFNSSGQDQQSSERSKQQQQADSKEHRVSGSVEETKHVKVRNAPDRLVAQISTDQGNKVVVDLGPAHQFGKKDEQSGSQQQNQQAQQSVTQVGQQSTSLQQGDRLEARGPMLKVGDKQVLVAHRIQVGNQQEQKINRSGRQIQGRISQLKTAKVRGQDHQLAILKLQSDQQGLVDLGPADKLQVDLAQNDQIQVTGVPVKVQDRLVFLANSVTKDGNQVRIERMARKQGAQLSN
jgi:hypothetical protein